MSHLGRYVEDSRGSPSSLSLAHSRACRRQLVKAVDTRFVAFRRSLLLVSYFSPIRLLFGYGKVSSTHAILVRSAC